MRATGTSSGTKPGVPQASPGAIIVDPLGEEPHACQRDYVVVLSDWTDLAPAELMARLKKVPGYDNHYKRTVGDFVRDVRRDGLRVTLADRRAKREAEGWQPEKPRKRAVSTALKAYAAMTSSASKGAVRIL